MLESPVALYCRYISQDSVKGRNRVLGHGETGRENETLGLQDTSTSGFSLDYPEVWP